MRIVRFYFEPWQKGGSPSPSPSILVLSPRLKRRQRLPKNEEFSRRIREHLSEKEFKFRQRSRSSGRIYFVKPLAAICCDVLARNVHKNLKNILK